jgi:hypothetical protein
MRVLRRVGVLMRVLVPVGMGVRMGLVMPVFVRVTVPAAVGMHMIMFVVGVLAFDRHFTVAAAASCAHSSSLSS